MRTLITIVIAALSLNAFGQVPDYVPADGLIAWYPFNGNALDESPNGNDGTLVGATGAVDRFGADNGCLDFDGVEDITMIPHSPVWENCPELSISFWLRPDVHPSEYGFCGGGTGSYAMLINKWGGSNESRTFELTLQDWGLGSNPNDQGYLNVCHNAMCSTEFGNWEDFPTNEWTQLTVVYGQDSLWISVNGIIMESNLQFGVSNGMNFSSNDIQIGLDLVGSCINRAFDGRIDDIGFWNRALTEEEVYTLHLSMSSTFGCTDDAACNFDPDADVDDGSCIPSGCMDTDACNFNSEAECEGEACDYSCCPGPGCCSVGHYWDWELEQCFDINPTDTNLDGCTDLNDLMDILAAYGDCAVAEFSCGDPVSHEGYDYSTVLIGDQCWFSENCRYLPEVSPSSEGSDTAPYYYVYDYQGTDVEAAKTTENYETFGVLYNRPAVITEGICPSGWHIPTDLEWQTMEMSLGMSESEANNTGWRGSPVGDDMKSTSGWNANGNGTNSSGFNGLPGGWLISGQFIDSGNYGIWMSSSELGSYFWERWLNYYNYDVSRGASEAQKGFSARCVIDYTDECGVLNGDNSTCLDECGVLNGDNSTCLDDCGVPNGDNSTCSDDCGIPNGDNSTCLDDCGVPNGDNSTCADCCGVPNGDGLTCDGDCGACNDNSTCLDECGVPYGDNSTCFTTCGDDISHEGYDYSTVQIGDQCWFSENCRYLPVVSPVSPSSAGSETSPNYYVYGYEGTDVNAAQATDSYITYGVLYNWLSTTTGALCPSGWHIPSDSEFTQLTDFLGGESVAGDAMKSTSGWWTYDPSNGTSMELDGGGSNSSGFTALPAGKRSGGAFGNGNGDTGYWWTSTSVVSSALPLGAARNRVIFYYFSIVENRVSDVRAGLSARCVRD